MKNKLIKRVGLLAPLILSLAPLSTLTATPLSNNILGYGCIVNEGNVASDVITITNADLVKAHGVLAPNTTITHVVNFDYDFGVTDTSCLAAKASINLSPPVFPTASEITFDSLIINGAISNVSIVNNVGSFTLVLTMTTQSPVTMATPFTYSVPFTVNANITIP